MKKFTQISLLFLAVFLYLPAMAQNRETQIPPVRENIEWLDVWMPNTNDHQLPRVLLIGNSITRAYNKEVEKLLSGKAYVARLATSKSIGDPGLIAEINLIMSYGHFDVIHFNNGMHGWGYTEEEYKAGFPRFFETIRRNAPGARLIWATTTPVFDKEKNMQAFDPKTERIRIRNQIAAAYLADKKVVVDDLFGLVEHHPEYYVGGDGTHLIPSGVTVMANQVVKVIQSVLPVQK